MNNSIPLTKIFSLIPGILWPWYIIAAISLTIIIRAILSFFKGLAIDNGEVDNPDKTEKEEKKWRNVGLKKAFEHSFCSDARDIKIDDYWLPAVIGYVELIMYPIFMAETWVIAIAAWITIKTASSWGGWQKTRTAYNRFLLGNILSLAASYLIFKTFNLLR